MKKLLLYIMTMLICAHSLAQSPTSVYLEVRNIGAGLELEHLWETDWGSYDRNRFDRIFLGIRVGTVGRIGGTVKVIWYFIGKRTLDGRLVIYGRDERSLNILPAYFAECHAASPELKSHALHLEALGEHYASGATHHGWIVSVRDSSNRILASRASSEELTRLFNDQSAFAALLAQKQR